MNALARIAVVTCLLLPATPVISQEEPEERLEYEETVEVTAQRLPGDADRLTDVPVHVTVIDREAIERSGAATLQDLLAGEAGVIVYDQVGNDIEKKFDLRGFTAGTGSKLYLDGAPLNDIRNNGLILQLVPLDAVQRVEIFRGSASNSAGSGSEAGTIHLHTLQRGPLGGSAGIALGSDSARRYTASIHDGTGPIEYAFSGAVLESDGFRENAGGDLARLHGALGFEPASGHRLELSLVDADSELGNPGALTATELELDRHASPYNRLDFGNESLSQASLNYTADPEGPFSVAANLFHRKRESEILSTGRMAAVFGGFFSDLDGSTSGGAVQATHDLEGDRWESSWTAGVELLDGSVDSLGYFTAPSDPGSVDRDSPASVNSADRRTLGLFVRNRLRLGDAWSLSAGLRHDRDRIAYRETVPDPLPDRETTFSETSFRIGAAWSPDGRNTVFASLGESFLPPTVEQLFAFPLFGSNPDLLPQRSTTYEAGWRTARPGGLRASASLVQIDTEDEIVYLPGEPPSWIGINANAESTRRRGVEASFHGRAGRRVELFAAASLYDAEYRQGPNTGSDVPLVPGERVSAGFHADLPAGFGLRVEALHVGSQVLDNDGANDAEQLGSYTVADLRLTWTPRRSGEGLRLFVEVRNLLDEEYSTRGIYAFDFSSGTDTVFLTPAPGRRWFAGAGWNF